MVVQFRQAQFHQFDVRLLGFLEGRAHLVQEIGITHGIVGFDKIIGSAIGRSNQLAPDGLARLVGELIRTTAVDVHAEPNRAFVQLLCPFSLRGWLAHASFRCKQRSATLWARF
jgi:hypothetical protein